jgi:uncharacterized membrane protein
MSDISPVQVVLATFNDERAADDALRMLEEARRQAVLDFDDAAVIRKDGQGQLHIKETGDTSTGKGAGIGAVVGGVIGLLAGPAGVVVGAGTGSLIGGLAAKGDAGLKDERLEALGKSFEPGTSAVVIVVPQVWLEAVEKHLKDTAANVMTEVLAHDVAQQLTQDEDVA